MKRTGIYATPPEIEVLRREHPAGSSLLEGDKVSVLAKKHGLQAGVYAMQASTGEFFEIDQEQAPMPAEKKETKRSKKS